MGIANNRDTTRSQAFTYDTLNRIVSGAASTYAASPAHCWGEQYTIDAWGNMTQIGSAGSAYTGCTQEGLSVAATAQNRLSGYTFDTAGNMTANAGSAYIYDAENRLASTAGVNYTYDGDGKRVQKSNGEIYWYGMDGSVLDETDGSGSTTNGGFSEYIFFGGKRIAKRDSSNNIVYYFADHLGTARVVTNASGTIQDDSDFYPFGGERVITSSSGNRYKFTGKERDPESNLDNFGARYYASSMGRFMSPDWSASSDPDPVPYADLKNPQSLNLYSYTKDNPTSSTDPDGHCDIDGEHHWGWCLFHDLGFYQTQKEQVAQAKADILGLKNMTINDQNPQDFVKNATNQQLILTDRALAEFAASKAMDTFNPCPQEGMSCGIVFPIDSPTADTIDWGATFNSEGEARAFARTKLGSDPVEVSPGKWRSRDGKWQYRAKSNDVSDNHVHLEQLNPQTGEVIQNLHVRWPEGTGR